MITADAHELARPLRPQAFGHARAGKIDDAIVEPAWPGLRVVAAVSGEGATVWEDGEEVTDFPDITGALARATEASADAAILEGYLTKQVLTKGIGVDAWAPEFPTMKGQLTTMLIGSRRNVIQENERLKQAEAADRRFGEEDAVNLVVVDLLWLDGDWLLDIPLLERKRVLESIIQPNPLVRAGLFVREPIDGWIASWRAQGFRAMTFKAANSRYRPGETANDWTEVQLPSR